MSPVIEQLQKDILLQQHKEELAELEKSKANKPMFLHATYDRAINWTKEQIELLLN